MKILSAPAPLDAPVAAAIGVFDGVHLGHQAVLAAARRAAGPDGRVVAVTFDRHPAAVLAPARVPAMIYPLPQRLRVLAQTGADAAWVIAFDEAFSRVTAEEFIRRLAAGFGTLRAVCVGADFVFGHRRGGGPALLAELGLAMGFATLAVEPVRDRGEPVSSTRIRDAVRTGDFAAAARWLGRPHALAGTVVRGDQRGRQLGWPTANLDVAGLVTPPPGVYAARARLGETMHPAAVNIGVRPTVSAGDARRVEAHLIGFRGDLYGRDLEIEFVRRLREERKFPSLAALAAQIAADVAAARAALS